MSGEDEVIERVASLQEFFRDELCAALEQKGIQTTQETEAYLVQLLDGYMRLDPETAAEVGFEKPAALILEEAMTAAGEQRIAIYRRLGDASLYSCGFFAEHLGRKVGPGYYRRLGRAAYKSLEDMMGFKQPGGVFHAIYSELAAKFDAFVDAFRVMSGRDRTVDAHDLESLLEGLYAGGLPKLN